MENENVAQCEVVSQQKAGGQVVPVAQFVLEEANMLSREELIKQIHEHCIKELEPDCVPYGYKIVDAFPVKNNGKCDMELIKQDKTGYVIPKQGKLEHVSF